MKKLQVKRVIISFLLSTVLVSSVLVTGCQKKALDGAQPTSSSSEPVTINVYSWTTVESMQTSIDGFEKKYPNIKVKYTKMNDALPATANLLLTSGVPIDCIPQPSADDTRMRATNGMYVPLDSYLKADKIDYAKTFGSQINSLEMVNGQHYALPYSIGSYGVYYNKAMFDKAGVSYPTDNWTWDDLRAAALKLTSGSGSSKIYGFVPDYANQWSLPAIEQLGADYVYKNNGKESNWDNPAFLNALQFLYDMETKDKSAWPISEYKALKIDTNPSAIFLQGKTAMYIQPSYIPKYSSVASYGFTNFAFGVANLPKFKSSDGLKNIFYTSDFSIPQSSKNKQAAWTFIRYFCTEAPEIFAQSKSLPPANINSLDAAMKQSVGKIIFDHPNFDQATGIKTFITNQPSLIPLLTTITTAKDEINDLVKSEVNSCLTGNETPDQAIVNIKKGSDALITKAKN